MTRDREKHPTSPPESGASLSGEAIYRELIENATDIIYTQDLSGRYTFCNRAVRTVTGYTPEELVGISFTEIVAPEYVEAARQMIARKLEGEAVTFYEVEVIAKDGHRVPLEVNTQLIYAEGRPVGIQGFARDITKRKRAEQATREKEQQLRLITDAVPALISYVDSAQRFVFNNRAYEEWFGRPLAEIRGRHLREVLGEEDYRAARPYLERALAGEYLSYEREVPYKDGTRRHVALSYIPDLWAGGEVRGIVVLVRDVTENKRIEAELKEQREFLRNIIDTDPNLIFVKDGEGRYTLVNRATAENYGTTVEEMIGHRDADFNANGEQVEQFLRDDREVMETGREKFIAEEATTNARGEVVWLQTVKRPLRSPDGVIRHVLGICTDISERKRAEEALKHSESLYHSLVESLPLSLFIKDREGRFTFGNRRFFETTRKSAHEILGRTDTDFFPPPLAEKYRADDRRVMESGEVFEGIEENISPNGDGRRFMQTLKTPVYDARGECVGVQGLFWDVTDRELAEETLREADRRAIAEYERLLGRLADLAQTLGVARDLLTVYRTLCDFARALVPASGFLIAYYDAAREVRELAYFWYNGQEKEVARLDPTPVRDGPAGQVIRQGRVMIYNNYRQLAAGRARPVAFEDDPRLPESALIAPMMIMGRTIGTIEVQSHEPDAYTEEHATAMRLAANLAASAVENVRLIEQERQRAEQLRQAQKMEAVGRLAGGIAHDFNNLLTAINGYSDLTLRQLRPGDLTYHNIEEVKRAAERAAALTRQLLAFSRKQVLQPRVVSLNTVVADLEKMLRRLIGEDIELETIFAETLANVEIDPGQLEQVIVNLAVNARDAMPQGGKLTIETKNADLDESYAARQTVVRPGRYVMLAVSDTGTGIDVDTQAKIFEPFFTTKELGKGTGLGLSTVYGIIKQSGGYIWVYSEVGQGTTFKIYLPRVEERATASAEKTESRRTAPMGRETILLVEDEELVRQMARSILEIHGYHVLEAAHGPEALEVSGHYGDEIHLMVTDVVMPQMSGSELAGRLQQTRPAMRVLFMSGYTGDAIVRRGVLEEGIAFLEKPFTPDALALKVRELLDGPAQV